MVRAACSEWLCFSAMSMAWSSVTRAGGFCGAAGAAACAARREGASSPKTPRTTSGPHARERKLDFVGIVSLLQGAVETLDRLSETTESRKAQENRIRCDQVWTAPLAKWRAREIKRREVRGAKFAKNPGRIPAKCPAAAEWKRAA